MRDGSLKPVGVYKKRFNELTGQNLPCTEIYQSQGLKKHVKKHHPDNVSNLKDVSSVIANPDYVGKNPKEADSVELVKVIQGNLMVCVKLDSEDGYFYVASVYEISNGKLQNRIHSGRLKRY